MHTKDMKHVCSNSPTSSLYVMPVSQSKKWERKESWFQVSCRGISGAVRADGPRVFLTLLCQQQTNRLHSTGPQERLTSSSGLRELRSASPWTLQSRTDPTRQGRARPGHSPCSTRCWAARRTAPRRRPSGGPSGCVEAAPGAPAGTAAASASRWGSTWLRLPGRPLAGPRRGALPAHATASGPGARSAAGPGAARA